MKSKKELKNDIQGIVNLINYQEEYPKGAVKIGYHYYNISSLTDAMKDIRTRAAIGGTTKADNLLMQILAGLM